MASSISAKRGSRFKHRAAEMEIRVTEMVSGKPIELRICGGVFRSGRSGCDELFRRRSLAPGFGPVIAGVVAVVVGLIAARF